ncbi:vacuolar protein sorting-associated protein VTA1, partial [Phenoliferia sp. Uapishka_3]
MASTVPLDLKPIAPYLARANELNKADPPIAYWCNYYAVQLAMTLGSQAPESNAFLFALMDKLELMKAELADNDAVADDAAASAYVENFALKVFNQADNEDRTGKATSLGVGGSWGLHLLGGLMSIAATHPKTARWGSTLY